jgi:hypothetical protein
MRKGAKVFIEHDARPVTVVHLVEVFRGRLAAAGSQLRGVPLPNRHLWNFFKSLRMFLGGGAQGLKIPACVCAAFRTDVRERGNYLY